MSASPHPAAPHHLPFFLPGPDGSDPVMAGAGILLLAAVLAFGLLFLRLHTLPERIAHRGHNEGFFQSLIEHPLPLREEAVKRISSRSMAIDLYIWLTYRLHALSGPVPVPWTALKRQFGESYKEARRFRREAKPNLALALAVYPEARVSIDEEGLILYPSPPPVSERKMLRA